MFRILNRKAVFYYAILLTAIVNIPRLIINSQHFSENRILSFNIEEWISSLLIGFLYVILFFYVNEKKLSIFWGKGSEKDWMEMVLANIGLWFLFILLGAGISRLFIHNKMFPLNGYFLRFTALLFLSFVALKIIAINFQAQEKEKEIQALRLANTQKDLFLLKSQLSPHFLFNAFSSLSGIVHENPEKAQKYVVQLSQYFRYSLERKDDDIASLDEELNAMENYCGILSMRLENGFNYKINISNKRLTSARMPYISLQPLIENAVKHNIATASNPLFIDIFDEGDYLIVRNNIQKKAFPESGTGTGLSNLSDRYQLLFKREIEISSDTFFFTVKLPLV